MKKLILLLISVGLLLCSCNQTNESGAIRFDVLSLPTSIDPQTIKNDSGSMVVKNIFRGLTVVNNDEQVVPDCAVRWEISLDKLTYTFILEDNLKWEDGTPLTATDFAYGITRYIDPSIRGEISTTYLSLKNAQAIRAGTMPLSALGVRGIDEKTLEIKLEYPDDNIPFLMAQAPAMPCNEKFFKEQKGRYGLSAKTILSNGDYSVWSWEDDLLIFFPNTNSATPGKINRVYMCTDRGDATNIFLEGRSEICIVPTNRAEEIEQYENIPVEYENWVVAISPNSDIGQSDILRKAMLSLVDKTAIKGKISGKSEIINNIIPKTAMISNQNYRESAGDIKVNPSTKNPREEFLAEMELLGLTKLPKTTILIGEDETSFAIASMLQGAWSSELSAYVNVEQVSTKELSRRVESGEFTIAITPTFSNGNHPEEYLRLLSYYTLESNSESLTVKELLGSVPKNEIGKAFKAYGEIEEMLVQQWHILPLYDAPSVLVSSSNLKGVNYAASYRTIDFTAAWLVN